MITYSKDVARWQRKVSKFVLKCSQVVFNHEFTFKNPQLGINLYFTSMQEHAIREVVKKTDKGSIK